MEAAADPVAFRAAVRKFREVDGGDRFLESEGAIAFVAIVDHDIGGWCWGQHMVRPDNSSMLYLHELEVDGPLRRQGLGRSLVEAFMAAGRRLGASKMFLTTGEGNPGAQALYEGLGAMPAEQGPTVNYWFDLKT